MLTVSEQKGKVAQLSQVRAEYVQKSVVSKHNLTQEPNPLDFANAAAASGVTKNEEGDLEIFITAVVTNVVTIMMCIISFLFARWLYPDVYEWELTQDKCPKVQVSSGWFDWARRCLKCTTDQMQDSSGLDQTMLMEFTSLSMKIMAGIGIPMICIMGPMNWAFGDNRAGEDHLSYLSFGNVVDGSWLYWIHCFVCWGVVICVKVHVYRAMHVFMGHRKRWLRELPEFEANTIMVEEIPEERQSDTALKAYFEQVFGSGTVKSATVVKICPDFTALCAEKASLKLTMDRAKLQESKGGTAAPSISEIQGNIESVTRKIIGERNRVIA